MRTDHVRYQKIDRGTVPLQSIRQASFCIFCTISSQQKHQLVDFLSHFIHATGIFSHFDKCNECLVSEELIEKAATFLFLPLLCRSFDLRKFYERVQKFSCRIYARKMIHNIKAQKEQKYSSFLLVHAIFSHMTCFIQIPSFLPQYILGSNRLLVS